MVNIAKDLPGIPERGALIDEIMQYIQYRYEASTEFGGDMQDLQQHLSYEKGMLSYTLTATIDGTTQTLIQKQIITVANKYDLIDAELRGEYQQDLVQHMYEHIQQYSATPITKKHLLETIHTISTMTKE
jgi:GTPase involved in cell partitioning and DNA repair